MQHRHNWTIEDMPRQDGRLAVVTGANSGIGYATARALAKAGAEVVLAGRDPDRIRGAAERMRAAVPGAHLRPETLDLADLSSVAAFAERLGRVGAPVDVLVNNAAVMAIPHRRTTKDGFELTVGTNHLGHFALTGLLLPQLLRSSAPGARVVTVSAAIARSPLADPEDFQSTRKYRPMGAYAKSKLANVLFALELQRRAFTARTSLTSVAVHPGTSMTGLQRHEPRVLQGLGRLVLERFVGQSADEAALPSLFAATAATAEPGGFYGPTGRFEARGAPGPVELPTLAWDAGSARGLWETSEALTKVHYPWPDASGPP